MDENDENDENGKWWNKSPGRGPGPGLVFTPTRVFPPTVQPHPPKTPHPSTLRRAAAPPPPPPPTPQNSSNNEGPVMSPRRLRPRELKKNNELEKRRSQKRQEFDALVEENHDLRTELGMSGSNEELEALLTLEGNPAGSRVEIINGRMQVFKALKRENEALNEALVKKGRGFTVGNAKRGLLALGAAGLAAGLGRAYLEPREAPPSLADPFGSYAGSTLDAAPAPVTFSTMLPPGGLEQVRAEAQAARELMPTPTEAPVPPAPRRSGKGIIHGLLYGKLQGGRTGTKRHRMSKRRRSTARRR